MEPAEANWIFVFKQVLFPLFDDLLEGSVFDNNFVVADEERLRAVNVVAKTLLQFLPFISRSSDFQVLWIQLLRYMQKFTEIADTETLVEGIRETLKNVLLVMDAQDVYQIIGEDMRDCTWAIIGKCRPLSDLQEQLAAESAELREVAVAQQHPHEEASAVPLETGHADKDPEVVGMMERFNWVVVTDRDLQESGPEEDLDETSPPVDYAATELDLR